MRILGFLCVTGCCIATACASAPSPVPRTLEEERRLNEDAYYSVYLLQQVPLFAWSKGEWLSIVEGRVLPADGESLHPAATMEEAVAAAEKVAPQAKHRFVFAIGEEGDVEWHMGGCELKHVVGVQFLALLERDDVKMEMLGPNKPIEALFGDTFRELTVKGPDARMYLRPEVGPPGGSGMAEELYCVSTGFGGIVAMAPETARGLELWEIPGRAIVYPASESGKCRRARARFAWPGSRIDFTVPVAIWPR